MLLHHLGDSHCPARFRRPVSGLRADLERRRYPIRSRSGQSLCGDSQNQRGRVRLFFPVIVRALNRALEEYAPAQYQAASLTGLPLRELETYIDRGIPVAVWATIGMVEVPFYYEWISPEDGKTYRYPAREHCLVLVGYDDDRYYFNDPYNSNGLVSYHKNHG